MKPYKTKDDMHFAEGIFGLRLTERRDTPGYVLDLFIEDDEHYYPLASFSDYWIDSLIRMSAKAKKNLDNPSREFRKRIRLT